MAVRGELRVGTSGYQYEHWRERFYPHDLPKKRWFEFYTQQFDTVEINNTFYNLPAPETLDDWRDQTPRGFRYALKYSRYGTHLKHIKDPDDHVPRFVEHAERLSAYLGPILVQLPPSWHVDTEWLRTFLEALPRRLRWAVEVRDPSWLCEPVYKLLREHGVALCIHDLLPDHPHELTTDWTYLRFHGPQQEHKYAGSYPHQALSAASRRISAWLDAGRDVYTYFNNDENAYATENARDLRRFVDG